MNPPAATSFRTGTSTTSSAANRRTSSSNDLARSVSPEDAPTRCAVCSQPLTVGERMFYFLEGGGEFPLCRACIAREQAEGGPGAARSPVAAPSKNIQFPDRGATDTGPGSPEFLTDVVRSFLMEELDRIDRTLDRVSETHPDLPIARGLEEEARQQLSSGRLADAVASLRDVRHILVGLERGRKHAPLSAPWDESVEALFDRVMARARAMARPNPTIPEEGGSMIPDSMPSPSKANGTPS